MVSGGGRYVPAGVGALCEHEPAVHAVGRGESGFPLFIPSSLSRISLFSSLLACLEDSVKTVHAFRSYIQDKHSLQNVSFVLSSKLFTCRVKSRFCFILLSRSYVFIDWSLTAAFVVMTAR